MPKNASHGGKRSGYVYLQDNCLGRYSYTSFADEVLSCNFESYMSRLIELTDYVKQSCNNFGQIHLEVENTQIVFVLYPYPRSQKVGYVLY